MQKTERGEFRRTFYVPRPLNPIKLFAALHDAVIARSEKRSPKWRFRLARNAVFELQPKVSKSRFRFEGRALWCDGAGLEELRKLPRNTSFLLCNFQISGDETSWMLRPGGFRWHRGVDGYALASAYIEVLVRELAGGMFDGLQPDTLLGNYCLICGKGLTDPVSMARQIGPECFGSASPALPYLIERRQLADFGTIEGLDDD